MSDSNSNPPSPANKSPGKGGKSLQLMQQRLMAQGQQPTEGEKSSDAAATANLAPAGSPPAQPSPASAAGRPKGKDFASMSARAPKPPPMPAQPPPTVEAASPVVQSLAGANRPKGKDFSAMQSRMGAPAPSPQAQSQSMQPLQQQQQQQRTGRDPTPQERARAAQMQAAARAAAGMPPLESPTATSIAQPNNMPVPQRGPLHQRQASGGLSQSSGRSTSSGGVAQGRMSGSTSSGGYQYNPQIQAPPQQPYPSPQQQQMQPPHARQPSYGQGQGGSGGSVPDPLLGGGTPTARGSAASTASKGHSSSTSRAPSRSRPKSTKTSATPDVGASRLTGSGPLLGAKIADLVKSIDPTLTIEPAAEEQVLLLVDDFIDKVVKQSMRLAGHRSSKTLDVSEIQLILDQQWGIRVPGLGPPQLRKKVSTTSTGASSSGAKRKASDKASPSTSKTAKTSAGQIPSAAAAEAARDAKK